MDEIRRRIWSRIDELAVETLDLLQAMIRINSTTPTLPGVVAADVLGGETRVNHLLQERYAAAGFQTRWVAVDPDRQNLVAVRRGRGGGRSLILNGHVDTVAPIGPAIWRSGSPWEPLVEDGRVFGLGATDMKGGGCAIWAVARVLHDENVQLLGDLQVHSVVGEEMMEHELGTTACIRAGFRADGAVVTEPTSFPAALTVSPVSAGNWLLRITVEGKSTHCGNRPLAIRPGGLGDAIGVNALEKAVKVVGWLQDLETQWGLTKQHPSFPSGFFTIGPNLLHADPGVPFPAYFPNQATIEYVVWYPPDEAPTTVARELEDYILAACRLDPWLAAHPPTLEWFGNWPAMETSWDHPLTQTMVRAQEAVSGEPTPPPSPAHPVAFGAVCDGSFYSREGIPAIAYGPGDLKVAHGTDESIAVDEILLAAKALAAAVLDWCGIAPDG